MMSDDHKFQHSAGHQHWPVLFADDAASKPSRLMYPFPLLKAVCLSGHLRLGMCYQQPCVFPRPHDSWRTNSG